MAKSIDLYPYLENAGLQRAYERSDGEVVGICPAHFARLGRPDTRPSFAFNPNKGWGYCFSCQWKPTLRELVTTLTGTAPDAQFLLDVQEAAILRHLTERKIEAKPDFSINEWTMGHRFQPVPGRLLSLRQLKWRAAVFFGIRFDPDDHCWVSPIRSPEGLLWGWQQRQKGAVNTYPSGIEKSKTLFGHHLMASTFDTVVLVESPLDAVRLWQCNIPGVASMGAGVSKEQVTLLTRHYANVILALDDDAAGRQQLPWLTSMLRKRNTLAMRWRYDGSAKDIGDYRSDDDIIETFREVYRLGF